MLERNFLALAQLMPGAAPNYISKFSRVKFGGPADQRNGYTTIVDGGDLDDAIWGDPDGEHQPGRGAGVQGVPQPVRRAVRRGAGGRRHGGDQVGHQQPARHRLLLRPRRRAERAERLPAHQARSTASSASAARSAARSCGTARTSSAPTSTPTSTSENIIALPASNPFAARENGTFPATSREHLLVTQVRPPASTTAARSSCATPSTTSTRPAPATLTSGLGQRQRLEQDAQRHRRAELGAVELDGQHPARALHVERGGHGAGDARRGAGRAARR